jgi:hypothetical protein
MPMTVRTPRQKTLLRIQTLLLTIAAGTIVRRAAFDVGSGYTKLLVADVDINRGIIIGKPLVQENRPMRYKIDAQQHPDHKLSEGIQKQGLGLLRELVGVARAHGAVEVAGVGTSVFRKAPNGPAFLEKVRRVLSVNIDVVDQDYETRLGLATGEVLGAPLSAAVWDSGGGSFQIAARGDTCTDESVKALKTCDLKVYVHDGIGAATVFKMLSDIKAKEGEGADLSRVDSDAARSNHLEHLMLRGGSAGGAASESLSSSLTSDLTSGSAVDVIGTSGTSGSALDGIGKLQGKDADLSRVDSDAARSNHLEHLMLRGGSAGGAPQVPSLSVEGKRLLRTFADPPASQTTSAAVHSETAKKDRDDGINPVTSLETNRLHQVLSDLLKHRDAECCGGVPPSWLKGASVVTIGVWDSPFEVAIRAAHPELKADEDAVPRIAHGKSLSLKEMQHALNEVIGKKDDELRAISGFSVNADPPSHVVPKIASVVAIAEHLGIKEITHMATTGSCEGLMALGEFNPLPVESEQSLLANVPIGVLLSAIVAVFGAVAWKLTKLKTLLPKKPTADIEVRDASFTEEARATSSGCLTT